MPKVFPPSCLKKPCSNFLRATCRPPPRPGGSTLLRAFFVKGRSLRAWACRDSDTQNLSQKTRVLISEKTRVGRFFV